MVKFSLRNSKIWKNHCTKKLNVIKTKWCLRKKVIKMMCIFVLFNSENVAEKKIFINWKCVIYRVFYHINKQQQKAFKTRKKSTNNDGQYSIYEIKNHKIRTIFNPTDSCFIFFSLCKKIFWKKIRCQHQRTFGSNGWTEEKKTNKTAASIKIMKKMNK